MYRAILIFSALCVVQLAGAKQNNKSAPAKPLAVEQQIDKQNVDQFRSLIKKMRSTKDRSEHQRVMKEILLFKAQNDARQRSLNAISTQSGINSRQASSYEVPFASTMNVVELSVENNLSTPIEHITIRPETIPSWLHIAPPEITIDSIASLQEKTISFRFDVDKFAPIKQAQRITFRAVNTSGITWMKEIALTIGPPDQFNLFQNYPNPFNPATTISYQLAKLGDVTLTVYNILGEAITQLVHETKDAGYYTTSWNASNNPSGIYYLRMSVVDPAGRQSYQSVEKIAFVK